MSKSKRMPDVIRAAMHDDGRTHSEIARDSGVAQAVLSRFYRGERDLNLRTADRLCKALGLELRPVRRLKPKGERRG
jgi:transcriptional regulator with XRE-family HTH domain